ncbi:hypothetical protein ACFP3Q_08615 [Nocardioides sp. GCM10027113]|uniref:hypothetical protein n=1 Tax=unclassified Nocardioides TaxID=2615069 RepID=UPI00360C2BBF
MAGLLLGAAGLLAGCGGGDEPAAPAVDVPTRGAPDAEPTPGCDADCRAERRADREARRLAKEQEQCAPLLSQVDLDFRITATPVAGGSEIGLHLTVDNRSAVRLSGDHGGLLRVASGQPTR